MWISTLSATLFRINNRSNPNVHILMNDFFKKIGRHSGILYNTISNTIKTKSCYKLMTWMNRVGIMPNEVSKSQKIL